MEIKATELIKIIDACGKNGVSHFKSGDLELTFNGFVIQTQKDYSKKVPNIDEATEVDPNFDLQQVLEEAEVEDEELLIVDPVAYEEKLLKGELEEPDK